MIAPEDKLSVAVVPPAEFTTGFGVKLQLTPVGRVAGVQANARSSPGIPVPAAMDNGTLTVPPALSVMLDGTVTAGAGAIVTCVVTENGGLDREVAVIVTVAGSGGGLGAVNNPELVIVPALAVQLAGPVAVNWYIVPATNWLGGVVMDNGPTPAPPNATDSGEPIPV